MLSPGVSINEIDLTHFEPIIGKSGGAFVGQFNWGAVKSFIRVNDVNTQLQILGKPTNENYIDWFSCSNFLSYSNNLTIVRVVEESSDGNKVRALNSTVDGVGVLVKNSDHFEMLSLDNIQETFVARYPGAIGDTLKVSLADSATFDTWEYKSEFDLKPATSQFAANLGARDDEIHIIIIDEDGKFTGKPKTVLEKFGFVSKALDAKSLDNEPIFFGSVINNQSKYLWYFNQFHSSYYATQGEISSINIQNPGTGYSTAPIITITGDGTGATAEAVIGTTDNLGQITGFNVTSQGTNYNAPPTVTITGDGTGATAVALINQTTGKLTGLNIVDAGSGYTTATVSFNSGSGATANATLTDTTNVGKIISITVTNGGSGYTMPPTVTIVGQETPIGFDGGDGQAIAVLGTGLDADKVVEIQILNAGTGYTAPPSVVISGDGTGATATAMIGGIVSSIAVVTKGSNYAAAPVINITSLTGTGAEAVAVLGSGSNAGKVTDIIITKAGSGYQDATIEFIVGDGAEAEVLLGTTNNLGKVVGINMITTGSNYSYATITFSGGTPSVPATAIPNIYPIGSPEGNWGLPCQLSNGEPVVFMKLRNQYSKSLSGGNDGTKVTASTLCEGWNMYRSSEEVDIGLLFLGDYGGAANAKQVAEYVIDNIAEQRRDCVVFLSPPLNSILNKNQKTATDNVVYFSNYTINRPTTTFGVMDSGWKLQYDVFSNKYRWLPLNADVAGLCAQTETDYDAWWSPAGFNRGRIKNCKQLAFNPNKESRDELYKNNINPIVSFINEGVLLYGDRTMQVKPSAFSYINVRRLFITLEKAIGRMAKLQLFEFNDAFTRNQFVSLVEPYLRQVQARRGIYEFKVVCDESNNTNDTINNAQFVASIFIKPARSINFVSLNFVAVRSGVDFKEVVGKI